MRVSATQMNFKTFLVIFILISIREIYNHDIVAETIKCPICHPFFDISRVHKILPPRKCYIVLLPLQLGMDM